ncbi:hypothetical protein ACLOJK_001656 [Asimina triloba]
MRSPAHSQHSSSSHNSHARPSSPIYPSQSESFMDGNIAAAETIISKWDPDSSSYARVTSLFYESRQEAREFLRSVKDLQRSMELYVGHSSSSDKLMHAQVLMQIAMKRLQKEFYQILAANRDQLDPESVSARSSTTTRSSISDCDDEEEEIQMARSSILEVEQEASTAMSDLQAIADCMISSGYAMECVKVYKIIRKSIVDEGIYRLGFQRSTSKQIEKMDWDLLEQKIKNWVSAMNVSVKTLFYGERILCDNVFASSKAISDSCFADIVKDAAMHLVAFPEAVAKCGKAPEKIFRFLDLYETIAELWPDIDSIFSCESTSAVRTQATSSFIKLGDAVRAILAKFESAMQKDSSKSPVPGGDLHPLTRYVMNYICLLGDYSEILADVFADFPLQVQSPLPEALLRNPPPTPESNPLSANSSRFEWLVFVLLCKLDTKAELYKDVGLSYLFLANNLQYVVSKVRRCSLRYILGDKWLSTQESKVRQFAANYERMAWNKVISALPENPTTEFAPHMIKERFQQFNSAFEAAYHVQSGWVVADGKLREEIRASVTEKIVPAYRCFYDSFRPFLRGESRHLVRFAPEDLENYMSDLFIGSGGGSSRSSSTFSSSTSRSHHASR